MRQLKKRSHVYLGKDEGEAIYAIKNIVIHEAENLALISVLEVGSDKESTLDQELANRSLSHIANYKRRQVGDTIKKYNVIKTSYIQIRLFTAKVNEGMKQVAYINYTLNEFKEMTKILGDFNFVENCKVQ